MSIYQAFESGNKDKMANCISGVKDKLDAAYLLKLCALFDRYEEATNVIESYKHYLFLSEMYDYWEQAEKHAKEKNNTNILAVLSSYPEIL